MEIDYRVIGRRIRQYRKQRKLTQEQLAERVEVSSVFIRYIENAKRTAKLDTYVRIVNALGCTMDDLLKGYQAFDSQDRKLDVLLADCSDRELGQITEMVVQFKKVLRS